MVFMKNPPPIPARKKEIYDYFLTCAPVGEWFPINYEEARAVCGMGQQQFAKHVQIMAKYGFVEKRESLFQRLGQDVRVIRRIVDGKLVPVEGLEEYLAAPPPKKKRLIPYAGKDHTEQARW